MEKICPDATSFLDALCIKFENVRKKVAPQKASIHNIYED
jgi:hypothetical protein